jgi:hypothetical protein
MSDKATKAHNRMQAEKVRAVNTMKAAALLHKVRSEDSAAVERYQRARIAALEIEVEELTRERDEARQRAASFMGMLEVMADATGSKPLRWSASAWAMATKYAEFCGWDCFKEGKP